VLDTPIAKDRTFKGLATNFLQTIMRHENGHGAPPEYTLTKRIAHQLSTDPIVHVPIFIRSSNFKLPRDHKIPVIMVGPGTGVAPFRGFVQERVYFKERGEKIGSTVLFYGCRRQDEDFLYKQEWADMFATLQDDDPEHVKEFHVALSRDDTVPKTYVQHMLRDRKDLLWKWLHHQKGYFYVCGDAKNMARAVNQTLIDVAQECGEMDVEAATKWVKDLRSIGRYQEDVWS
jgi:NADPH-ferrihemoprotein reductase